MTIHHTPATWKVAITFLVFVSLMLSASIFTQAYFSGIEQTADNVFSAEEYEEHIINGGFEDVAVGWDMSGPAIPFNGYHHSGIRYAVLGALDNCEDTMSQTVTIPESAGSASLSYWYNITSDESNISDTPYDKLEVSIRDSGNNILDVVDNRSNIDKDSCAVSSCYHQVIFDMKDYIGQTVKIYFYAETNGSKLTFFRIDDVSLKTVISVDPNPQCSDGVDNDGDGKTDNADCGCHTDGDSSNFNSYDPLDDSEAGFCDNDDPGNGGIGAGTIDISVSDSPDPFNPSSGGINIITINNIGTVQCVASLSIENIGRNWGLGSLVAGDSIQTLWNGRDETGNIVPPGVYNYTAICEEEPLALSGFDKIVSFIISTAKAYFLETETGTITVVAGGSPAPFCGNGNLETGEECDGNDFGGQSCESFGFDSGNLSCSEFCQIITNGCSNNTIEIKNNSTGGECSLVGNWDVASRTCLLSQDLNQGIMINSDNIILDGNGHTIMGNGEEIGVYLYGRNNVIIKNLNVKNFKYGIHLVNSNNNRLEDNAANLNRIIGILLSYSGNNILVSNISLYNDTGIRIENGSNNTLTGNMTKFNDGTGINLVSSSGNLITENIIDSNGKYGVFVTNYSGSRNNIYFNNFINNIDNAYAHSFSNNNWSSIEPITYTYNSNTYTNYLGNYYDNYTNVDTDNNGIWDNPYVIDENNQDNYPLMQPFENYVEGGIPPENQPPELFFSQEEGYINDGVNPNEEIIGGEFDFKVVYNDRDNNPPEYINLIIDKKETFGWHQYYYKKKISVDTNCNNPLNVWPSAHSDYGIGPLVFGCKGGINSGEEITLILEDEDARVVNVNLLLKQHDSDKLTGKIPTARVKVEGMIREYDNPFSVKIVDMIGNKVDSDGAYFATTNIKITEKDYKLGKVRISVPVSTGEVWIGNIKIINRGDSAYNINSMHISNFANKDHLHDGIYNNDEQYQKLILDLPYGTYSYYFEFKNQQSDMKRFPENYDQSFEVRLDNFNPIPNGYQFKNGRIENISTDSKRILANEVFGTRSSSIIPLLSDLEIKALFWNLLRWDRPFGPGGLCYGVSLTSIGEHNGYLNFLNNYNDINNMHELSNHLFTKSNDNYDNIFDASGDLNNKPLLRHLIKHHLMQFIDTKVKGVENVVDELKSNFYISDYLLNIRYDGDGGNDGDNDGGGHAIVPLYIETLMNDVSYKIYVYDPNLPKEINYLYINKNNNKWKWSYPPLDSLDLGDLGEISLTEIESVLPEKNFFDNWDTFLYIQEDLFIKMLEKGNEENFTGYVDNLYYDNLSEAELFFPSGASNTSDEQNISRSTIIRSDDISKYEIKIWNTNSDIKDGGIRLLGKDYYLELTGKVPNTPYVLALTGDASKITLKNLSDLNKLILKKVVGSQGYQVSINRIPALLNGEYIFSIDWQALSQGEKSVTVQIDEDGDGEFEKTIITDATLEFPTANAGEFYENAEGAKIIFDASLSTDLDGSIILYEWDFDGDGNYDESSTLPTIAYTYGDDYNGEVILRVTDDEGLTDITTNSVIINNVVPILSDIKIEGLFHPEQEIWAGDGLNFFGNFTDPGWLDSHTAIWDFGDETTLTGLVVEENSPPAATGQVTGSHIYYDKGIYTVTFIVKDDDGGVGTKTLIVEVKPIPAVIDFVPDTLNLASKGKFITAYIELPEGYDVTKINVFSIMLNNLISVLSEPTEIGDYDNDGIPDLMVKFDRSKIQAILTPEEEVTLTLVGELVHDDIDFKGFDTIRVINPGEGKK